MSKNLNRKGLALGAIVALGATVFAGTPAFAANELNVVPSAGTSYNAVAGSVFNLATTFAPGFTPSSYAQLKYIVTSDANSAVHYGVGTSAVASPTTSQAVSLSSSAVTASSASATTVNYIGLKADDATVTSSVSVTAFVDANNDGAVSAGEWNTVKTVTFKKLADITPVVTLAQPNTGDTTVSATVAWGDLNIEQANRTTFLTATGSTNSALGVEFKVGSGAYPTGAATGVSYSSTTGKFSMTVSALAASASVSARAVYATNTYDSVPSTPTNTYSATALGSAASAAATARTISSLTAATVAGTNALTSGAVRTNGSYVANVTALNTATTPVAAAGVAIVGSVAATTTATDLRPASTGVTEISVTVNGTKYTSETTLNAATFALTTDASGVATLNISSVGLSAGDVLTADFKAQNFDAYAVGTQTDATYTASDDNSSATVAANKNTATTLSYSVKDQFGVLSALTNQRLVVTATTAATVTQYIAVVAGKATAVITPVTDSTADITVGAALQASTTGSTGNVTWGSTINTVSNTIVTRSAAYSFTVAPAIDATNGINNGAWTSAGAQKQTLTTVDQSNTAATGYVAPAASTTWAKVTLTGSNAGEKLTVSGTGVFLSIDGAAVAKDSVSKVAQGTSAVIYVASNTTGAKTLTVTNGTVSATVVVTFDKAGSTAGKTVALGDLAALSQAGRSVDVSAVITDVFGNPVQGATVTLSATGVGYLANNGTTTSDASGKVTAKLIVGAAETGDAVVTATSTLADATVATASKTVTFGSTDANVDIVNNRVTAVATFTKGKTVAFYVDGVKKWSKASASDADVVISYNLKKGTHTVAVKISGGFSAVEKFIVK